MLSFYNLNKTLNKFEKGLNMVGYVPFVGSFSGGLRIGMGKIGVISGVALTAIGLGGELTGLMKSQKAANVVDLGTNYIKNGVTNIGRGILEFLPGVSLVTCLPYDLSGRRISYLTQPKKSSLLPQYI